MSTGIVQGGCGEIVRDASPGFYSRGQPQPKDCNRENPTLVVKMAAPNPPLRLSAPRSAMAVRFCPAARVGVARSADAHSRTTWIFRGAASLCG